MYYKTCRLYAFPTNLNNLLLLVRATHEEHKRKTHLTKGMSVPKWPL